jgi:hypothetical protein
MKAHRTIPADLEDWLQSFRSSLEKHPFSNATVAFCGLGGEQPLGLDALNSHPKPLFAAMVSDNLVLSFAI